MSKDSTELKFEQFKMKTENQDRLKTLSSGGLARWMSKIIKVKS